MAAVGNTESSGVVAARELVAGLAGVVVASFAAVALSPDGDPAERVLVMAVACGMLTAVLTDWRATVVVVVVSVLVFVGVLADGSSAAVSPWEFTPIFALAALLGAGNRKLRAVTRGWQTSG